MARIRSLGTTTVTTGKSSNFWVIMKTIFVGICLSSIYLIVNNHGLLNDFKRISLTQYQIYVYGKSDYCNRSFDSGPILQSLRKTVYGQSNVLNEIDISLRAHEHFTSLTLAGAQGVGKTLTIDAIEHTFPWQYNIQRMSWSNLASEQSHLYELKQ